MVSRNNQLTGSCVAVLSLLLLTCSSLASADWQLNPQASYLYYVSSKVSAVSEVNTFSGLSGLIDEQGKATLNIDLASVDTAIDIRNQRVRDILFQVIDYPQATASLDVDLATLQKMLVGSFASSTYAVDFNLHGITQTLNAELQVSKLNADSIQVQLTRPLIISAANYGLAEGVEELREIAKLPSINNNVVVGFTLLFEK